MKQANAGQRIIFKHDQSSGQEEERVLHRQLEARHLTMIAIGGSIGTGLFLASGASIHSAGPGGALLAYAVIGFMVYLLMTSLGEMAAHMPVTGSFCTYASKFADPALGFALGWNYWFSWAITLAVEAAAAGILMKYWLPDSPSILWSGLFLGAILGLNLLSVKKYGEAEYWFSLIKVTAIAVFIITGFCMIFGIMTSDHTGFSLFTAGDGPFSGGLLSIFGILMVAGFSFQGTEIVGIVAGESKDPKRNIPKAVKQIFWRILFFYILTILIIGLIIPYNDERLIGGDIDAISMSPFTMIFEKAGIAAAASVMNAVILTSILSAGNSGLYASARMLWKMAEENKAPAFLRKVNKNGVPVRSILVTLSIGFLAFLSSLFDEGAVFMWLLNASGLAGFIAWAGIAVSHYRFRKAYVKQGFKVENLAYRARWYPAGPLLAAFLCIIIILGQNYQAFTGGAIDFQGILVTYIGLFLFAAAWLGYKVINKTKWISLEKMDVTWTEKE